MIDMYPRSVGDLLGEEEVRFRLGCRLVLRCAAAPAHPEGLRTTPKDVYPGSVARLFAELDVLPQDGLVRRLRRRLSGYRYAPHSIQYKTPVVFWKPDDYCLNCHQTNKPVSLTHVLPIMHFKFTADLVRKIGYAVSTGGYNQGSRSYRLYAMLIERMRDRDGAFVAKVSRRYRDARDLTEAGIAR